MWSWCAAGAATTAWLSDSPAFAAAKRKVPGTLLHHGKGRQKYLPADLKIACPTVQSSFLGNNQVAKKSGISPSTLTTKYHSINWKMGTIGRPGVSLNVFLQLCKEIRNKHMQTCNRKDQGAVWIEQFWISTTDHHLYGMVQSKGLRRVWWSDHQHQGSQCARGSYNNPDFIDQWRSGEVRR